MKKYLQYSKIFKRMNGLRKEKKPKVLPLKFFNEVNINDSVLRLYKDIVKKKRKN